jgi:voltage-gated potassium channel
VASLTAIVILATAQLLYEFADFPSFGEALHAAAYGAITGEPVGSDELVASVIELLLAAYSVVVFASLAGILGAFFLDDRFRGRLAEPDRGPGLDVTRRARRATRPPPSG